MELEKLSKNEMLQVKGGEHSCGEWVYIKGEWIYIEDLNLGEDD